MQFIFCSALECPEIKCTVMEMGYGKKLLFNEVNWLPWVILSFFLCSNWAYLFVFLLWLLMAPYKTLPFTFSLLTYLCNRSAKHLLTAQPVKGEIFPSAVSGWLYPSYMCHVRVNLPGLGHRDPFVVSKVDGAYGNEAWQRSKTQDFNFWGSSEL